MKLSRFLVLVAALLAPSLGQAQEFQGKHRVYPLGTLLSGIALNADASTRSFTFSNPNGGFAKAVFSMVRTRVAGEDLSMTCSRTNAAGVASKVQTCSWGDGDGICTHVDVTWFDATDGSEAVAWELSMLGWFTGTCTVASTNAGGSDLLTATGNLVTQ